MPRAISIERVEPRTGRLDQIFLYKKGYGLVSPAIPSKIENLVKNCKFVKTIKEAADLIGEGFYARMGENYRTASLIMPSMTRVVR